MDDLFKGRHFEREVIVLCVRWCLRCWRRPKPERIKSRPAAVGFAQYTDQRYLLLFLGETGW